MFPIIPAHILNTSAPSSTSIGKLAINTTANNCTNAFWNVWTEDFLKRKYFPSSATECLNANQINRKSSSESERIVIKMESRCTQAQSDGSFAMNAIPREAKSRSFNSVEIDVEIPIRKIFVTVDSSGYLKNDQHLADKVWLRCLNIAHDTYSNNVQLEVTGDRKLRMKIVKNIVADEEILLWFSEEVLAILGIPFLAPANILGKNCYKCTDCEKIYENPNPLKLHLATRCDRITLDDFWVRLNCALMPKSYSIQTMSPLKFLPPSYTNDSASKSFQFEPKELRTTPSFVSTNQPYHPALRAPSVHHYHHHQLQHLQQLSAFQPVPLSLSSPHAQQQQQQQQPQHASYSAHPYHRHPHSAHRSATTSTNTTSPGDKVVAAAAAQLETIVSNMGTSKQGHICIYCGKLYSRKYGLKIHIRTHTGFKPLKCKYCLRPFGDPSNLNKHIRLHVQEKSLYKCHLCSKMLVRRRDLLRHMNIKHNANGVSVEGPFSECDNSSDNNLMISSANRFNEANSSASSSINGDVHCNISSNDEGVDGEFDVKIEVD